MDLRVVYFGKDLKYWAKIQKEYSRKYSHLAPTFALLDVDKFLSPREAFTTIYRKKYNVIYLDFSEDPTKCLRLAKLLTKNNVTRKFSTVALHELSGARKAMQKTLLAGVRISHIKCVEMHDVIYDPIAMLNIELAPKIEYAIRPIKQDFKLKQDIRISYVAKDHFHVETNSMLTENEVIVADGHLLNDVMPSNRFVVRNPGQENLYYNTRFSYDLYFTFLDNDFFRVTEADWIATQFTESPPQKKGWNAAVSRKELDKRKRTSERIAAEIAEWIAHHKDTFPKKPKLKVLILDETLEIFNQIDAYEGELSFLAEVQTSLPNDAYQISRTKSHLIVVRYDPLINNAKAIEKIIAKIKSMNDYDPYLVVFGIEKKFVDEYKKQFSYSNLIIHEDVVDLSMVEKLANKIDARFHINNLDEVTFLNTTHNDPFMTVEFKAKYIFLSESLAFFECAREIPMWTVLKTSDPIDMFLTVIPIPPAFEQMRGAQRYCALINGLGEIEKAKLRKAINSYDEEN